MASDDNRMIPLTAEQKQRWTKAIEKMDDTFLPALAWQGAGTEHKYVFVASFDGTWNDRENLRHGEYPTNPALLEKELSKLYNEHLAGDYYNGVGTRENPVSRVVNGMFGDGSEQKAEQAFNDFQKQSQQWLKTDERSPLFSVETKKKRTLEDDFWRSPHQGIIVCRLRARTEKIAHLRRTRTQ